MRTRVCRNGNPLPDLPIQNDRPHTGRHGGRRGGASPGPGIADVCRTATFANVRATRTRHFRRAHVPELW